MGDDDVTYFQTQIRKCIIVKLFIDVILPANAFKKANQNYYIL